MKLYITLIFSFILAASYVYALEYDCSVYGCRLNNNDPIIIQNQTINQTVYINNASGTGNASTGYCPAGYAVANVTTGAPDCVSLSGGSMDYAYVNTNINNNVTKVKSDLYVVIDGNLTAAKVYAVSLTDGNNTAWLSTYNVTYHGLINNASYLTTYNVTYDLTTQDVNANRSFWFTTYNASYDGLLQGNASLWTEAKNKYNVTYHGLINNASYLSTYNSTYDTFWTSNTTIWNAINSKIDGANTTVNTALNTYMNGTNTARNLNMSSTTVNYNITFAQSKIFYNGSGICISAC